LFAQGQRVLVRAVQTFDFDRGFKFSTYATWAIMKHFAAGTPNEKPPQNS
jgi:DNA-directed RNA polymerase sigma subunit (sigma70/sigma32)